MFSLLPVGGPTAHEEPRPRELSRSRDHRMTDPKMWIPNVMRVGSAATDAVRPVCLSMRRGGKNLLRSVLRLDDEGKA